MCRRALPLPPSRQVWGRGGLQARRAERDLCLHSAADAGILTSHPPLQAVFKWLYMRMVAGSRVWSWLYFSVLQKQLVGTLAKEARKAEAAGQGKLAPAAA